MGPFDEGDELEPTPEQVQTLLELGVTELEIEGLTYSEADELIESIEAAREPQKQENPRTDRGSPA